MRVDTPGKRFWVILTNGVWPLIINFGWFLFLGLCYDRTLTISNSRNVIFIIGVILFYITGIPTMSTYFRVVGTWIKEFNGEFCCITTTCILYPFLYLITTPMTMIHLARIWKVPSLLWDSCCCRQCRLEDLHTVHRLGITCISCRHLWVGIPFCLFYLLYVIVGIVVAAVIFIFLNPLGLGPLAVALHIAIRDENGAEENLWDGLSASHYWNCTMFGLISCLAACVITAAFLAIVGILWFPLFLFVVALLYAVVVMIPSVIQLMTVRGDDSVTSVIRGREVIRKTRVMGY